MVRAAFAEQLMYLEERYKAREMKRICDSICEVYIEVFELGNNFTGFMAARDALFELGNAVRVRHFAENLHLTTRASISDDVEKLVSCIQQVSTTVGALTEEISALAAENKKMRYELLSLSSKTQAAAASAAAEAVSPGGAFSPSRARQSSTGITRRVPPLAAAAASSCSVADLLEDSGTAGLKVTRHKADEFYTIIMTKHGGNLICSKSVALVL